MCLERIVKNYDDLSNRNFGIGYKAFIFKRNQLTGTNREYKYKKNKWLVDSKENYNLKIGADSNRDRLGDTFYNVGFHVFLSLKDANEYKKCCGTGSSILIFRVRYRDVVAFGPNVLGWSRTKGAPMGDCVVARQIYIEEQVN